MVMKLDLEKFYKTFPTYKGNEVPMWSNWNDTDELATLEVVIPGFTKEDFILYIENGTLSLTINTKKRHLHYSILDKFYSTSYKIDEAKAEYSKGILIVTIPKVVVKSEKVTIEVK
jgi:HSP20 family molecular chaperone IbpA